MWITSLALAAVFALPVSAEIGDVQDTPGADQASAAECAAFANDRVVLTAHPPTARQGETLTLRAHVPQGPYAPKSVPITCLTQWTVHPAGAASVSPLDGRLTIAPDAPAPEILTVGAQAPGGFAHLTTALVGRDDLVLTGRWSQVEIDCGEAAPPKEPVRELEFDSLGGFSVTYLPFETYRDYWGQARFDATLGKLDLTVTGENFTPRDPILSGPVRLDAEGRLILDGFNLGEREPTRRPGPCRYVFART